MDTVLTVELHYILVPDGFAFDEAHLSAARRERIAKIRDPGARALSAAADLALDAALRRAVAGYSPPPALLYAPDGRPTVPGAHVSLSHTRGLAACAVASMPVGLDVECARRDLSRVRRKLLAPGDAAVPLVDLWVAKEAYLKLTGEGLAGGMQNYSVNEGAVWDATGGRRAFLAFADIAGFRAAVCCAAPFRLEIAEAVQPSDACKPAR